MDATKILDNLIPLLVTAVVILVLGVIAVRVLVPLVVTTFAKRRMTDQEREAFSAKAAILECAPVIDLYAPTASFQKEHNPEKDKRKEAAWLSPYPRAVRAAYKRPRRETKRTVTMVRKQIKAAAQFVSVATLPEELQPGNHGPEHMAITLKLNGEPEAKIMGLVPAIKSKLGLHSLVLNPEAVDFEAVHLKGHKLAPLDRLEMVAPQGEFFREHPATRVTSIPLALKANGEVWSLRTHHTLIHGTTGSGKGSPIQGILMQLEPFIKDGVVKLYGIDPKNGEFKAYRETSLFEGLALGNIPEMIAMIHSAYEAMKHTQDSVVATEENDHGRSVPFDRNTPLRLVIIDELLGLLTKLKGAGKAGTQAMTELLEILSQGRSGNMFVIAATQAARQDLMGDMRDLFNNKIVLRLEDGNQYWNRLWLGETSLERGYDALAIGPSGPENGYATAGIGYVKEVTGNPVKVRFARTTAADITALKARNKPLEGSVLADIDEPLTAAPHAPLSDDDLSDSWTIEEGPEDADDDNNDERALPALD